MARGEIVVKGIRDGLLIILGEGDWEERLSSLDQRLQAGASFFQGGRAALDVGDRELDTTQVQRVRDLLHQAGVELFALLSTNDATILAAVRAGLAPNLGFKAADAGAEEEGIPQATGLVVERTVRSGQHIEHPGDVIVLGNVHAGAEVIAGRHIIVWGKIQGVVHAGAMGDEEAVVCALDLSPTQLRIAGYIARSPENRRKKAVPEMARVRNGHIEAIPWQ